jgi:hypothetical protein
MKRNKITLTIPLIIKHVIVLLINNICIVKKIRVDKFAVVNSFITKSPIGTPLEKNYIYMNYIHTTDCTLGYKLVVMYPWWIKYNSW